MLHKIAKIIVVSAVLIALSGNLFHADAGERLTFVTEEWKPFNYVGDNDEIDGFSTLLVRTIAANLNQDMEIMLFPWSRSYSMAQKNNNHVLYSAYRNSERENLFKWVGPLFKVDAVLWGRKSDNLPIKNLDHAKKYLIAVQQDSAYHQKLLSKGFEKLIPNPVLTDIQMVIARRAVLVPLSITSLKKLRRITMEAGEEYIDWKAYATILSNPLHLAFNINTPDEVISKWQMELDKIRQTPLYREAISKYIQPLLNEASQSAVQE